MVVVTAAVVVVVAATVLVVSGTAGAAAGPAPQDVSATMPSTDRMANRRRANRAIVPFLFALKPAAANAICAGVPASGENDLDANEFAVDR
ncbi:MAG: hypothetical protein A2135_09930 [Actinobacteria bacterium RBG_16_67_15]|nr:MAG: hypothetical protein A2135_09930 [Actinobacteria bacterium RBG_16_67_15]